MQWDLLSAIKILGSGWWCCPVSSQSGQGQGWDGTCHLQTSALAEGAKSWSWCPAACRDVGHIPRITSHCRWADGSLGAGTPGTRPRTSGSAGPPAGHGAAAPGAGKQRPFGLRYLLPSCRQMLGHRLCHPTVPSLSQGLCNHLTPSARRTAGDCLTCGWGRCWDTCSAPGDTKGRVLSAGVSVGGPLSPHSAAPCLGPPALAPA